MRKTDRKTDNTIRVALTEACDSALETVEGFQWLTHQVDYDKFPQSLVITCVFDTNEVLSEFRSDPSKAREFNRHIQRHLDSIGVKLKDPMKQILYDTEEQCSLEHKGNWAKRLK